MPISGLEKSVYFLMDISCGHNRVVIKRYGNKDGYYKVSGRVGEAFSDGKKLF
jgi:3'-phosphoadenosine 5'-phosphosulfate sulfotransferase